MSAKRKNALGRGLGALLNDSPINQPKMPRKASVSSTNSINDISLEYIEVNPFQPRTHFDEQALNELKDSIKTQGIIQPITVRKLATDSYQLISGERRLQASKLAGLTTIPAYIRTANDQQMLEMALIENIQRENLNSIEVALSYQQLITECGLKQEELGDRVGKKRSTVTNYLRLLKLPPDVQLSIQEGIISMGHARALIGIENIEVLLDVFKKIIQQGLSVRKTEEMVRLLNDSSTDKASTNSTNRSPEIKKLQSELSSYFGTKIQVKADDKNKGEIKIPFVSTQDLNRILEILDISL
ncbi:MAG: ParB/RepB/Spo0J family partition protein [Cyclobacteriaceae bacterium]|nr:ParB/RepB/Spo0J family partition protein [Cyclobacteriaceae bacterium]